MTTRADIRRPLSEASILSVQEAVIEIGGRDSEVRAWLAQHDLVKDGPGGRRVVSWRQVLALVETGQGPGANEQQPKKPGRLPRTRLGRRE